MTIFEIKQAHPNCWVVIAPVGWNIEVSADREKSLARVQDWNVLNSDVDYNTAKSLYNQYLADDLDSVCLYDTSESDNAEHAADIARFFRVHFSIPE